MPKRFVSWMIGGPQGSGINVAAETLAKAFSRGGLHVFANIEYHSNIMGKHSYYRVRVSEEPVHAPVDEVHLLAALDEETLFGDHHHNPEFPTHHGHVHEVVPGGGIIYDADLGDIRERLGRDDLRLYPVPYFEMIRRALEPFGKAAEYRQYDIMRNTVALGATLAVLDYDFDLVAEVIREQFKGRRARLADLNIQALRVTYDYVHEHFGNDFPWKVRRRERRPDQILIRGVQAVALGKLQAGLGVQTYYPISPATDESTYLEAVQSRYNVVVIQTEDEISAINMAVGAAHAGARASTSTAGPGFALMPEGIGFAAITEAPGLVVFLYQRGGPSTGLPTRTEQADLGFALHPAHGEFPHIVIAPGDVVEAFYDSFEAFNWADRYQMPVIVLVDKYLASSYVTVPRFNTRNLVIDRGVRYRPDGQQDGYLRHAVTESGISPWVVPGTEGVVFWTTSDEHNPKGHISEGVLHRVEQMDKRMRKLELAAREIPDSKKFTLHGPEDAQVTLVGWGTTKGAILDALEELSAFNGLTFNFLQIRMMRPFPAEPVGAILRRARRVILIENNYSGQLGNLIREMTGFRIPHRVLKYDGRPFTVNEIIEGVRRALQDNEERIVMISSEAREVIPWPTR
ncbi:2-oxoacid:acceptor oxidoreductase subunit alpha [Thermoflexus sp.]|jgi:2-oxoglutarate ferredoxin oxidoreductase subunit alpha|uniref:2-oxoacid:acceptor oxidoreductase subunit alpha n=1 Tax=Thermoflexus sp. TaxID=1969742 RepID=UPI002639BBAD|nr:2-oxoacid:acceptor oxidoreductase subunit alpha [Thermoflexus sp.]